MVANKKNRIEFADLKAQYMLLREDVNARILNVLEHGRYILGPEVGELEAALASYTGSRHCVSVASGTEALLISLMALGIGPGDEVITTPFTFVATAEAIVLLGATPVFVDVESETGNIDSAKIGAAITSRTRAIMPVSLYGQAPDMDEINAVAALHGNIPVIEDAAQSFGATYKGRFSTNLSTIGCTSFFPSKPLGCYGDGGAIFTNDDDLAQAFREIRTHGQSARYRHTRIGVGGRMDTIQCAVVLAKLVRFSEELSARRSIAERYRNMIRELQLPLQLFAARSDRESAWAQFTVLVDGREQLVEKLHEIGVPTAVHYPVPLNRQPAYEGRCGGGVTPIADSLAERVLSLPMSAYLTPEDQRAVVLGLSGAVQVGEDVTGVVGSV